MPLCAVDFWVSAGIKNSIYSHDDWYLEYGIIKQSGDTLFFGPIPKDANGNAFLYGGNVSFGISLKSLMFGLGVSYITGSGKTIFRIKTWDNRIVKDVMIWKLNMINVYVPVIYRFDETSASLFAGLSPIYTFAKFKDAEFKGIRSDLSFKRFVESEFLKPSNLGLSVFSGFFLEFGKLGIGQKLFLNYFPTFSGSSTIITDSVMEMVHPAKIHIKNNLNYGFELFLIFMI